MQFIKAKGILSSQNGMNIYRGCTHGCIYCDSRSLCYHTPIPFENIEVKENSCELLESALKAKRKKCMIGTGSMSDPYMHCEKDIKLTRRCLEVIEKYGFGVTVLTKSNLILRDIDILERINKKAKAVVQMTLTTFDDKLCKILEPNVCVTSERVKVLKECLVRQIPTVVWLDPFLPYINDTFDHIAGDKAIQIVAKALVAACPDNALCVRFGGDEMLAVMEGDCKSDDIRAAFQRYLDDFNNRHEVPFTVSSSIGILQEKGNELGDQEKVFKMVDDLMYEEKKKKKHR